MLPRRRGRVLEIGARLVRAGSKYTRAPDEVCGSSTGAGGRRPAVPRVSETELVAVCDPMRRGRARSPRLAYSGYHRLPPVDLLWRRTPSATRPGSVITTATTTSS